MIRDMWTIITKDLKEIIFNRGTARSGLLSIAVILGLIGVYLPLQGGEEWLTNPVSMLAWAWLPVFLVVSVVHGRHRRGARTAYPGNPAGEPPDGPGHPAGQDRRGGAVRLGAGDGRRAAGSGDGEYCPSGGRRAVLPAGEFPGGGGLQPADGRADEQHRGVCLAACPDRAGGLPAYEPGDAGAVPDADHPGAGAAEDRCNGRGSFSGWPEPEDGGRVSAGRCW